MVKSRLEQQPSVPYSVVLSQRFSDNELNELRQLQIMPMQFRSRINVRAKTAEIAKLMAYDYYVALFGGDHFEDLYDIKLVS